MFLQHIGNYITHTSPNSLPLKITKFFSMAVPKFPLFPRIIFFLFSILLSSVLRHATGMEEDLSVNHHPNQKLKEKLSKFTLYWHDRVSGSKRTSIPIVNGTTKTGFGFVSMIDNKLTKNHRPNSELLGRAQGFYAMASLDGSALLMVMNFLFITGKYNGSTISILGRNAVLNKVREMPVIGGSGLFRFARGYARARTHTFNNATGDAIVKYTVSVLHF